MCERLYKKIKDLECESNLYISNNKVLFETIYDVIRNGVPIPSSYYINEQIVDKETNRYIMTKYVYDVDELIFKVEAHAKIKQEKKENERILYVEEEYLKNYEVEDSYQEDRYNELDSLQIYVYHNQFHHLWNDASMSYFFNCYHDEQNLKIHTHILEKEECGYDLQIELYEIPTNSVQAYLVSNHLSKIKEALYCAPLMHFFLSKMNIPEHVFEKFIIRKNEVLYFLKTNDFLLVVISIHYEDEYEKYIALGLCKNIHFTTKTMDLPGNLDCSFYTHFPTHLITSEYFTYNQEEDLHNYKKEKKRNFEGKPKRTSSSVSSSDQRNQIDDTINIGKNADINIDIENGSNEMKREQGYKKEENIKEVEVESNKEKTNIKQLRMEQKQEYNDYENDDDDDDDDSSTDEYKSKESDTPNETEEEIKIPNVGFMSLKMDIRLFSSCKDFSELIQVSSRIAHIIISFRDFLNNALVLYRIKQRRTF